MASQPPVIVVEGLDELEKALANYSGNWKKIAGRALGPGMAVLVSDARREAPVDTGRLRSSIGSEIVMGSGSEIIGKVGSKVEYASYQEYGTRYQKGKPYLRPAVEKNRNRLVKLFEDGIARALRELGL